MAVCGDVAGGVGTFVNRISTRLGDSSAADPPHIVREVVLKCSV
jgi:hypothetical protein